MFTSIRTDGHGHRCDISDITLCFTLVGLFQSSWLNDDMTLGCGTSSSASKQPHKQDRY